MIQLLIFALIIVLIYYYYTGGQEPNVENLEERVKLVSAMFPHIQKAAIEEDLRNGSRVEETCEKIMSGRLAEIQDNSSSLGDLNRIDNSQKSMSTKTNSYSRPHLESPIIQEEPPKIWDSESNKRQELLRQRKAFMIQQARLKFINKD